MSSSDNTPRPEWDRLLLASQKNHPETIRSLIEDEGVSPSHGNRVGQTALHIASLWGHVESVLALLELGANVNATNTITGATPLHCAIQASKATPERRMETVQLLCEYKANPSLGDFFGSIPLDYCEEDEDDELRALLQPQVPAVFVAIRDCKVDELKQVLEDDATAVQSRHGSLTALLQVITDLLSVEDENAQVRVQLLQLLLEKGADSNATPTAKRNGHLLPQEEPGDNALHQVCTALKDAYREGNADRIQLLQRTARLLKEYSAEISQDTQLLLHDAARRNQVEMATFLIQELGISPNVAGRQGMTPLQFAARSGKREMVEYLLGNETIDITIQDERGQTPLDAARANGKDDIVVLLEEYSKE